MTHSRNNISQTEVELSIVLSPSDLEAVSQKTLSRLSKKVKAPGFRPGKVPAQIAKKHLDPNLLNAEIVEDAVNFYTAQILDKENVIPLERPHVEVTKFVPGQELEYTAKFEIIPAVKLGDYKNLKAKKEKVDVPSQEITEVIERMRLGAAQKQEVKRAAQNGDEVLIDFSGKDTDGKPVPGAEGKDYPLSLGSNTFIPGFEEGLVGRKAGEEFQLPLTFPKDYHHKPLAGAKVDFKITVKAIKEVQKPELNDEFAKQSGPFKTVDDLKADIKRELTNQKEREALDKLKDSLVEQLVKASSIPVPEILIKDQMTSLEQDFIQNLAYRGQKLSGYLSEKGLDEDLWRQTELRPQAERRVQIGICLAELSKLEDIKVSDEEIDVRQQEMIQYYRQPDMQKQFETPEARRDLANRILTEKTVDHLVALNS